MNLHILTSRVIISFNNMKVIKNYFFLLCSFVFTLQIQAQVGIRGVWLTNVDSDVLTSREKIIEAVNMIDELGFNTIFTVVWNKGMTQYKSEIMKNLIGLEIDTMLKNIDPLEVLIEEAHKRNIKVFAWFEYGFASSYKQKGGKLIQLKPHWASKDRRGKLVSKNGFEWLNGFHPEVQEFILSLIKEVISKYNVDGIQGDDRLPAMPVESGYDQYTVFLYKKEHNGKLPPKNFRDSSWIDWRAKKLNDFMNRLYYEVKSVKSDIIVSMAPSIYPWSKEEYLQDWVTWVNDGYVDLIIPQLYRYNFEDYKKLLDDITQGQIKSEFLYKFYPGVLLKVGKYIAPEELIEKKVNENRKKDINGEVYFFFEGLKSYPAFFKKLYSDKIKFPEKF